MSEFIGSRISLVSKSDIRYVGTLHQIDSNSATVALENVSSFGTEGRRQNPDEEVPPSDQVYEYIVFRGSDVKDLKIEEPPVVKENRPPPNDPAILEAARPQGQNQRPYQQGGQQHGGQQHGGPPHGGPTFPPQNYPPPYYGPPPGQWGPGGPNSQGYPMPPYGPPPPAWMPPQGFPPGQFPTGHGPYGQFPGPHLAPGGTGPRDPHDAAPNMGRERDQLKADSTKDPANGQGLPKKLTSPVAAPQVIAAKPQSNVKQSQEGVRHSAPSVASDKQNGPPVQQKAATAAAQTLPPPVPQSAVSKIMPALPLSGHIPPRPIENRPKEKPAAIAQAPTTTQDAIKAQQASSARTRAAVDNATAAATAAVAAAMASLPPINGGQQNGNGVIDNLSRKVNDMRIEQTSRAPRNPNGSSGFAPRGGRSRGGPRQEGRKIEIPTEAFDFEGANAKFNKEDLVKEAIAGSPLGADAIAEAHLTGNTNTTSYNKKASFFDDLSSEQKDRSEGDNGGRSGGREFRAEERSKNFETFGQGSVDNGYRGGFRGRGRGRGRGTRARGRGFSRSSGDPRAGEF